MSIQTSPILINQTMVQTAVTAAITAVYSEPLASVLKPRREQCWVAVGVPDRYKKYDDRLDWTGQNGARIIYEYGRGDPSTFDRKFAEVASSQLIRATNISKFRESQAFGFTFEDGTSCMGKIVQRRGIAVTTCGLQPWVNDLISGMVADLLLANLHAIHEQDGGVEEETEFPLGFRFTRPSVEGLAHMATT